MSDFVRSICWAEKTSSCWSLEGKGGEFRSSQKHYKGKAILHLQAPEASDFIIKDKAFYYWTHAKDCVRTHAKAVYRTSIPRGRMSLTNCSSATSDEVLRLIPESALGDCDIFSCLGFSEIYAGRCDEPDGEGEDWCRCMQERYVSEVGDCVDDY